MYYQAGSRHYYLPYREPQPGTIVTKTNGKIIKKNVINTKVVKCNVNLTMIAEVKQWKNLKSW